MTAVESGDSSAILPPAEQSSVADHLMGERERGGGGGGGGENENLLDIITRDLIHLKDHTSC